jgi:hypothetical protein
MAFRRQLGNLATLLLRSHLQDEEAQKSSALQHQKWLSEQGPELLKYMGQHPTEADNVAGMAKGMGLNLDGALPSDSELLAPLRAKITSATTPEAVPTPGDILAGARDIGRGLERPVLGATPSTPDDGSLPSTQYGPVSKPPIQELLARATERKQQQDAEVKRQLGIAGDTAYATDYGKASGQAQAASDYSAQKTNDEQAAIEQLAGPKADAAGKAAGAEAGAREDALHTPGRVSARVGEAGRTAGAQEGARMQAEWLDPKVVAAKLNFENQKRIGELAQIGDKVQAEEVAKKNAAVKGLLPVYQQYRQLAVQVANSWAGANSPAASAVVGSMSHIPAIGEMIASGMETAHAGATAAIDPKLGKQVAELNRLTDTLAQGMANAVLGNRGQTTENDRRTAKNILASSYTDAKSLEDLLAITDRMFTLMPTVAGQILKQDPMATPSQILQQVAAQAKAEKDQAAPQLTPRLQQRLPQ